MSRHRSTRQPPRQDRDTPQQLPPVAPVPKAHSRNIEPETVANLAIQHRAKPSAVPGHVRLAICRARVCTNASEMLGGNPGLSDQGLARGLEHIESATQRWRQMRRLGGVERLQARAQDQRVLSVIRPGAMTLAHQPAGGFMNTWPCHGFASPSSSRV